ncbi:MAG: ABC transporter ATP-binding protein [Granulosicoccaceae bacterium]
MLELAGVNKQVGTELHINDVSLKMERGSLNILLGPTLSGKTSLMRLMAGLDRPTGGDITIDGKSVVGVKVRRRNIAMVYQQFINYPAFTVYENIASPLRLAGLEEKALDDKVREAADLLKLSDYLERTPLNLSGGQQQRTAIARALVKDAELVLLDEPLANLDYKLREELRVELPRIFSKSGAILIYATTEPYEALMLGGHTATLCEGCVTQFGSTIEVYKQPVDITTAQIFSDPPLNIAKVQKTDTALVYGTQQLGSVSNDLPNDSYTVAIRPHHVSLSPSDRYSVKISAVVTTSEMSGSETFIHVETEQDRWVLLTHGVRRVNTGDAITLYLDPTRFYMFNSAGALVRSPVQKSEVA